MQYAFEFYKGESRRLRRPERMFFAVLPDPEMSSHIGSLRDRLIAEYGLKGAPVETPRLHISLHHVGDYRRLRSKFLFAAERAGNAVSLDAFEVILGTVHSFDALPQRDGKAGRRPLVLLAEGNALLRLHENLGHAMRKEGLKAGATMVPHMTLLYGTKPVPTLPIEPLRLAVGHFALIHSERGRNRYNLLARWPLRGRSAIMTQTLSNRTRSE